MASNHDSVGILTDKLGQMACTHCGAEIDISEHSIFEQFVCPHCENEETVPGKLGNFLLIDQTIKSPTQKDLYKKLMQESKRENEGLKFDLVKAAEPDSPGARSDDEGLGSSVSGARSGAQLRGVSALSSAPDGPKINLSDVSDPQIGSKRSIPSGIDSVIGTDRAGVPPGQKEESK